MNACRWTNQKEYSDRNKKYAAYKLQMKKLKEIDPDANKYVAKNNSLRTCFQKEL
jgi:hypothetical protein